MAVKRSEGLLVEARPLRAAEEICSRVVDGVTIANGALLLSADPAWAGAINTVLVKKGVTVNELRRVGDTKEISKLSVTASGECSQCGCSEFPYVPSFTNWSGIAALTLIGDGDASRKVEPTEIFDISIPVGTQWEGI